MGEFPKLQESWIWPLSVERWFRERMEGYTLHVCCGTSDLGDVTLDRDPENAPDVLADMDSLPFGDCTFDTAIWDPPWRMSVWDRNPPWYELVRCTKPDGRLLVNSQWEPTSHQVVIDEVAVRQDTEMGYCSQLWACRRYPGQTTLPV